MLLDDNWKLSVSKANSLFGVDDGHYVSIQDIGAYDHVQSAPLGQEDLDPVERHCETHIYPRALSEAEWSPVFVAQSRRGRLQIYMGLSFPRKGVDSDYN